MTKLEYIGVWIVSVLVVGVVAGLAVLSHALGGGAWYAINVLPYIALFVGGWAALDRS